MCVVLSEYVRVCECVTVNQYAQVYYCDKTMIPMQ